MQIVSIHTSNNPIITSPVHFIACFLKVIRTPYHPDMDPVSSPRGPDKRGGIVVLEYHIVVLSGLSKLKITCISHDIWIIDVYIIL